MADIVRDPTHVTDEDKSSIKNIAKGIRNKDWASDVRELMATGLEFIEDETITDDNLNDKVANYNNYIKNSLFGADKTMPAKVGDVNTSVSNDGVYSWLRVKGNSLSTSKTSHGVFFDVGNIGTTDKQFSFNIKSTAHALFEINMQVHDRNTSGSVKSYPIGKATLSGNSLQKLSFHFMVPKLFTDQYIQLYIVTTDVSKNVDFQISEPKVQDALAALKPTYLIGSETAPDPIGNTTITPTDNFDGQYNFVSGNGNGSQGVRWLIPFNDTTHMTAGALLFKTSVYNASSETGHYKVKYRTLDKDGRSLENTIVKEFDIEPKAIKSVQQEFRIQWNANIYNVEIQLYCDNKIIANIAKNTSLALVLSHEQDGSLLYDPIGGGITVGGAAYAVTNYLGMSAVHVTGGTATSVPSFLIPTKAFSAGSYRVTLKLVSIKDADFELRTLYKGTNGQTDLRSDVIAPKGTFKAKANTPQEFSFVYDAKDIPSNISRLQIAGYDSLDFYLFEAKITPAYNSNSSVSAEVQSGLPRVELTGDFASMTKDNSVVMQFKHINGEQIVEGYSYTKWQGQSSIGFPAKNLKLKTFEDSALTKKLKFRGRPDMPQTHKHNLKVNYVQPYQARNLVNSRLIAEIASTRDSLPAGLENSPMYGQIQGLPAECYINGNYYGLTSLNTQKDDNVWGLDDEDTQFVFEGNAHSAAAQFNADDFVLDTDFTLEYPDEMSTAAHDALAGAMKFIKNSDSLSDDDFKKQMPNYFDVASVIDWMIVIELIQYKDGMDKNICWNSYDGKTLVAVPYDVDSTWGLNFKPQTAEARLDANLLGTTTNKLLTVMLKRYPAEIKARWNELKGYGVATIPHIQALFADYINNQIGEGVLEKHWDKWPETAPVDGVTDYNMLMRSIRIRLPHCDRYFNGLK